MKITDVVLAIIAVITEKKYFFRFIFIWAALLFGLLWLFNLPLLYGLLMDTPKEVPRVLIEGYLNLFRGGFDLTPLLLVLTSGFQAMSFSLSSYLKSFQKQKTNMVAVNGLSLIGAGCVACGGSVVAPLLSIFGLTSVAGINRMISNTILFFACLLSIYTVVRVGKSVAILLNNRDDESDDR